MNAWNLPTSLNISGVDFLIRTDFRNVLNAISFFNNPEYELDEQWEIFMRLLFEDFDSVPQECYAEAIQKAIEFVDMGKENDGRPKPRLMDWEQDASIIIPAINRVMGTEVRSIPYVHWWTFLGAYMEIGESLFSSVVSIRHKKSKGQKLEKWEQDFYRDNKNTVDLQRKYSKEEMEEIDRLNALLG